MSPILYRPGLALFAGASVGFLVLTVRALELAAYGGAALIGGFLVLSLWQSGVYFRRNRPGRYRPEAPPRYSCQADEWDCLHRSSVPPLRAWNGGTPYRGCANFLISTGSRASQIIART